MVETAATSGTSALRIGTLALANNVLLAPMAGITDAPVRQLALKYGAGLVVSEMIASGWLMRGEVEARLRAERVAGGPSAVQLAGCEADRLTAAAELAEAAGADLIDLNMGCPARKVVGGEAGAALMRDLDHAERLIAAVVERVRVPVTVKMRLGWDEASLNAAELAKRAEGGGRRRRHRARPHPPAVLFRPRRLGGDRRGEARGVDPGDRQWRHRLHGGRRRLPRRRPAPTA